MWQPLFCFHFLFILVFFSPGIFYSLHAASLRRSLQHVEPPLPREGAAFAAIFASSSLIPWPSLLSAFLSGHEKEPSLSSLPAVCMDLSYSLWMRTLVTLHLEFYFSVVILKVPHSWSHMCSANVYPWWLQAIQSLGCPDPKCHQGMVRE